MIALRGSICCCIGAIAVVTTTTTTTTLHMEAYTITVSPPVRKLRLLSQRQYQQQTSFLLLPLSAKNDEQDTDGGTVTSTLMSDNVATVETITSNYVTTDIVKDTSKTNVEDENPSSGGLPWWWEMVWDLDVMKLGEPGTEVTFGDSANVLRTNIEQIYGNYPSLDGCPLATGELNDIAEGTMFVGLQNYFINYGSPYKLCFGPKSFLVVSDPVQARHILRDANKNYDKGILAEILEPIMGKGLIPADPETWSVRRRQIVPAFHAAWLEHMVGLFGYCNQPLIENLNHIVDDAKNTGSKAEMETYFCSVALDIIGLSVFNYNFGSVTTESPVIKAVYSALVEAEHRSMTPAPYWNIPLANQLVPRLRKFNADLKLLNNVLDELIDKAKTTRVVEDIEELEKRNYNEVQDPSLLRFLVDMRGADIDNKQLRDDLMTMLIAGHETTAAVLTWALFELVRNPQIMAEAQKEIDIVLGDRTPTYADIKNMKYLRLIVAETLRMYPEPPLLIRRCRTEDLVPKGGGREARVIRGMDIFMAVYTIHRDERFWPQPDTFDPLRFTRKYVNPNIPDWAGFDPEKWEGKLYPNEIASDFAYLPFGGGARKCVGDEFAVLEATVTLAMVLRRFDFDFDPDKMVGKSDMYDHPKDLNHPVGMKTGATIHTRNGLHMIVKKREM
jgi:cytochrome P450 family 97 subfamily B polypeptide 3